MRPHSKSTSITRATRGLALAAGCIAGLAAAAPAHAQDPDAPIHVPPPTANVSLGGPRFGVTYLSDGIVRYLAENEIDVSGVVTQFGWQFEKQFFSNGSGVTAVNEWVILVGGLEQDVVLPSISWIVGLRAKEGAEFGVGPNVTPMGTAVVFAAGLTFRAGALNLPVNFAVVPSKAGTRVSLLGGFNFRKRP